MSPLSVALTGLVAVWVASTVLWMVSLRLRDASIADPFWGPGFLLAGATYLLADGSPTPRGLLVTALVAGWAGRLGIHLWVRNRRHGEDPRYQAMRAHHGVRFPWVSLVTVFWLQAVLLWVVSLPIFGAVVSDLGLTAWDAVGVLLFLVGLATEATADAQLARFTADPGNRGKVLDRGLWRFSRHPNYFGDALLWWGVYFLAVGAGAGWTVVGPVLMTVLLVKVSGVALLERTVTERRPGYAEYARRTSAFVPWFRRRTDRP
jgi:steroid 5-alpha reductase family enzyme